MIPIKNQCLYSTDVVDDLVCVITHKRKDFISKWLRAWNNAEHYGSKIAVIHAVDGSQPDEEEKENILKYKPDFYIPFKNSALKDLAGLIGVCRNYFDLPTWSRLYWFTDDMLPMRRVFLKPFVEKIKKNNVGLVAQCYEPKTIQNTGGHIRTVAYAITREVANNLKFPEVGPLNYRSHLFEHGKKNLYEDHILKQVVDMGYEFELSHSKAESENYQHWTSFLDWMWDCHLLGAWEDYWNVYEDQFNLVQRLQNVDCSPETLLSVGECETRTSVKNKICFIIPTSNAPIECLMWSIFSLLLRSKHNGLLEHIIVGINGPDKRTGNVEIQDQKQKFLEELRDMKWVDRDMPLTINRVWSRVGHCQTLEQCVCWAHTEYYVSMHDDVILLDENWENQCLEFFQNEDEIIKTCGENLIIGLGDYGNSLLMPHINTAFCLCKKALIKKIGGSWIGYHIAGDFYIGNFVNYDNFIKFYKKGNALDLSRIPQKEKIYNILSMDIGYDILSKIIKNNLKMSKFKNNTIKHFEKASWGNQDVAKTSWQEVKDLEEKLKQIPEFYDLYLKYKNK
jgi:hypothetical protein